MNIFALDYSPELAALYHSDIHVPKMLLEGVQILSMVAEHYGKDVSYRTNPSYLKHPCTQWAMACKANYQWLASLVEALQYEQKERFALTPDKYHKSYITFLQDNLWAAPAAMPSITGINDAINYITPFALAMPESCQKFDDRVDCYRYYYTNHKSHLHEYSRGVPAPTWFALYKEPAVV